MKSNHPLAVWSLVLGILSIVTCGPVTGVPAIICGHMARSKIKSDPNNLAGDGMALVGLIMGYFSIVAFVLFVIFAIMAAIIIPSAIKMQQNLTNSPVCGLIQDSLICAVKCIAG